MAEDLKNEYKGSKNTVISVFLQAAADSSSSRHASFTTAFLNEVERQLRATPRDTEPKTVSSRSISPAKQGSSLDSKGRNDDELRQEIVRGRSCFDRAFIIVDDLDIVRQSPEEYSRLEEELYQLHKSNFKILTTSRVPFKANPLVGSCNVHGPEDQHLVCGSDDPVLIWWECPICVDAGEAEYYICDECFLGGHRCLVR